MQNVRINSPQFLRFLDRQVRELDRLVERALKKKPKSVKEDEAVAAHA